MNKTGRENTTKSQADKFKETARKLEADESTENFERNLRRLVQPKKDTKPDRSGNPT